MIDTFSHSPHFSSTSLITSTLHWLLEPLPLSLFLNLTKALDWGQVSRHFRRHWLRSSSPHKPHPTWTHNNFRSPNKNRSSRGLCCLCSNPKPYLQMHAVVWGVAMTNKIWINQFKATQSDWENIKELSPKWIQIVGSTFSCGMKWLNPSRTNTSYTTSYSLQIGGSCWCFALLELLDLTWKRDYCQLKYT